jgi:hypothetical protein
MSKHRAEDEVAGINCDIADFLSGMSSTGLVTACINASDSLKKGELIIGGQFWHQEGRSMTATNPIMDGMPNTCKAAILSTAAEAVEWTNPMETVSPEGKRQASRVIVYPADMPLIEEAVEEFAQNPSDREDGSHIAFTKILSNVRTFEHPPRILREGSSDLSGTYLAAVAPLWLSMTNQASVGSRSLVREDGPDLMNSSDEDSPKEERGDELTGMYTDGCTAPVLLTQSQVAQQKAFHAHLKSVGYGNWIDSGSNCPSSSEYEPHSQSVPSSPTNSRTGSRFDEPNVPASSNPRIPRAKTPTGEMPTKPTVSTAVTPPPPQKASQRPQFLSDSSGVSEDEPAPAQLLSSRIVPEEEIPLKTAIGFGGCQGQKIYLRFKKEGDLRVCRFRHIRK